MKIKIVVCLKSQLKADILNQAKGGKSIHINMSKCFFISWQPEGFF